MSKIITILGPTATGKTAIATHLAKSINAEIISADSRQVYRGMDIGTGKDIAEYTIDEAKIPYHLIDIVDAGEEYNLFNFLSDFHREFELINNQDKNTILCGGTGLYIHGILKGYNMKQVDKNDELRAKLNDKSNDELIEILKAKGTIHNITDTGSRPRLVRAIEIALTSEAINEAKFQPVESETFGILYDREVVRKRITQRLKSRLEEGMIEEVKRLIDTGVSVEQLIRYGLEYKYITNYIQGTLKYDEMFELLKIAIHQFSKRQMTWFRKMEREGIDIKWIDGNFSMEKKIEFIVKNYKG